MKKATDALLLGDLHLINGHNWHNTRSVVHVYEFKAGISMN